ncbi:ABC transporter ATP-binding protein [Corynebacterium sp. CCM 9185]|uniref:ABC transporter ATP-binding protein n=1 Tax=Corynebacterium marambiense TaxID=2765364 RepID=A0ABS0VX39_9CORY|nr:ABC transporter ATP-binding protein [Corynebacterium marambiense]MBI9001348.1 ABC transporter ATP-binding protein [Corynebacterium marambiense]MCK7663905.1 ABC transporter ATP-binding protein [Corynebacterium marambiense]MCX7543054.1 ABC transporter ATP-binding protein [Corynebacterium marambiense]
MIEVSGLTKKYRQVRAVDDLTFSVNPGVVTGFLGPNGAGKSTTMRMILGLDKPTAGTATINGVPYRKLKNPLREVGALLDAKATHPNRSAANHLKWIAKSNGIPKNRVDEVLGLVGLSDVAGKKTGGFSLGMGQRLGLATALLGDPGVLLLDEPINGLDPEGIRWVRDLLKALAREGRTVLVSSHMLSEMALTADHLIVIGRGKLVSDSSTYDFIKESSRTSVLMRTDQYKEFTNVLEEENIPYREDLDEEKRPLLVIDDVTTDFVGGLAYSTGIMVNELTERKASLEEAFLQMTGHAQEYHAGETPGQPEIPGAVPVSNDEKLNEEN